MEIFSITFTCKNVLLLKPKIDFFFTNTFFHYKNFFWIFYPFHEKKCLAFFQVQILFYFEAGNFLCRSLEYFFFSQASFFMILIIFWTFFQLFQNNSFEEAHNFQNFFMWGGSVPLNPRFCGGRGGLAPHTSTGDSAHRPRLFSDWIPKLTG